MFGFDLTQTDILQGERCRINFKWNTPSKPFFGQTVPTFIFFQNGAVFCVAMKEAETLRNH